MLLLRNLNILAAFAQHTSSAQTFIVYGLHYYCSSWPHRLIGWQLYCPTQIGKQARDVVRGKKIKHSNTDSAFLAKEAFSSSHSLRTEHRYVFCWPAVVSLSLHWWMKRRTCTKSGFLPLGPACLVCEMMNIITPFDLGFWLLSIFFRSELLNFLFSLCCRTGTVHGTQPTQT